MKSDNGPLFEGLTPRRRMLALAEGRFGPIRSKTANGALAYIPDQVVAVIDSTKTGSTARHVLGYGGGVPVVKDFEEGLRYNPDTFLVGIAPRGGQLPKEWRAPVLAALRHGLNIISGLHTYLSDDPEFSRLASQHHCTITDLRKVPEESHVVARGSWKTRRAKTVLTVGTDVNIGKMVTTLEVFREFRRRGVKCDFVATGQTGILIRGRGVAVDSIVGDYIAGSVEREIDRSDAEGFDCILVEGQGSLTHQGYSGVTLGLMHGTMPDAMIMCVQPSRLHDDYDFAFPELNRIIRFHEEVIGFFRPSKVVGIGVNSVGLSPEQAGEEAKRIEDATGLPAVDAFAHGGERLAEAILRYLCQKKAAT